MKYFLDTEFVEGTQQRSFLGIKIGETKPTIDLISIGIVAEDGREYYAISKDFNLKEAWNRFDKKIVQVDYGFNTKSEIKKIYWLRENVLYPIFVELFKKENQYTWDSDYGNIGNFMHHMERSGKGYSIFEKLIYRYGKSNSEIANGIQSFIYLENIDFGGQFILGNFIPNKYPEPEFYADYCSYDWVVFCWLFGKMINLPPAFPMYCNDIQQLLEQKSKSAIDQNPQKYNFVENKIDALVVNAFSDYKKCIKKHPDYPKQDDSKKHHALEDARYDRDLYNFLSKL